MSCAPANRSDDGDGDHEASPLPAPVVPDEPPVATDDTSAAEQRDAQVAPTPPPRSGKGSGIEEWWAFAHAKGVDIADTAERADIIAARDTAGHFPLT